MGRINNRYKRDMKQTAVEWFAQKLSEQGIDYPLQEFEQAKEMEKEQIIKAFNEGTFATDEKITAEKYYNETFKSE